MRIVRELIQELDRFTLSSAHKLYFVLVVLVLEVRQICYPPLY